MSLTHYIHENITQNHTLATTINTYLTGQDYQLNLRHINEIKEVSNSTRNQDGCLNLRYSVS